MFLVSWLSMAGQDGITGCVPPTSLVRWMSSVPGRRARLVKSVEGGLMSEPED